ncbi:DNA-processing protein DprA [Streptococcus periodonticum]|uniref:DNA-protecting protein DprA n=1 Tax=Streptococcus periodonticum TaxID=2490633 RepID=A0A3Q9EYM3_9STRE|nr:DNA-processing protein DprA [Streptococcus periodonticum]AZQ41956.1 DNA-protecting protein DprA [Streptococcus periodonticum]
MFKIDNKIKQEALNFSTLQNCLKMTESKFEPIFDSFVKEYIGKESVSIIDELELYCSYFKINRERLNHEYIVAYNQFTKLKETDEIIKRGTSDYPEMLESTEKSPKFLYIRGRKSLLYELRKVSLVGSRNATEKAKYDTARLAQKLGKNGITVISGLAKGIDVSAHKAVLDLSLNTIAVIGTHLNQYYPAENKEVQLEIEKKGLVVSQFSPASKTQRWFFPMRNRVMSALSLATIVMEAGETSGSLIQADYALKQGRLVLLPESALENENIAWPRKFVNKGAKVMHNPSDALRILAESSLFQGELELEQEFEEDLPLLDFSLDIISGEGRDRLA